MKRSGAPNALEEFNRLIVARHNELIVMDYPERIRFLLDVIAENPGRFGLHDLPQPLGLDDLPDDFKEVVARCVMRLGMDAEFDPQEGDQGDWEPILEEGEEIVEIIAPEVIL